MNGEIKDVHTLEDYLSRNQSRLGTSGQAMGRALYLSQKGLGGLTIPQIEEVLDEFSESNIRIMSWFLGCVTGIYSGIIRPDDIRYIIDQASR